MFANEHCGDPRLSKEDKRLRDERIAWTTAEDARVREIADRPVRQATAKLERTAGELITAQRNLTVQELQQEPSTYLAANCTAYTGSLSSERVSEAVEVAVTTMTNTLSNYGIIIHPSGLAKMIRVAHVNIHQFDTTSPKNLLTLFSYMDSLGMFNDSDCTKPEPVEPEVQPERELTAAELLERQETTSREGLRKGRALATEALVDEAAKEFRRWKSSVYNDYGRDVTKEESDRMISFMRQNNIAFNEAGFTKAAEKSLGLMSPEAARNLDASKAYDLWRAGNGKFSSEREQRRMYLLIHRQHGCPAHETLYR